MQKTQSKKIENKLQDSYVIETQKYEFIRDISGLGNPILLVLIFLLVNGYSMQSAIFIIGLLFVEIVIDMFKIIFFVDRPVKHTYTNLKEKLLASSFPSLHIARLTYFTMFFKSELSYFIAIILIFLIGYSRYKLGKHRSIDLIVGAFLGVIIYLLVQVVYQRI